MEPNKLNKILDDHKLWLKTGGEQGKCAYLGYADLNNADLSYADLHHANLSYANLHHANLYNSDLSYADLNNANLRYTNLSYADLYHADLRSADLNNANLRYTNLSYADLYHADLSYANLCSAYLSYANLRSVDLRSADLNYADLDFSAFPLWCGGLSVHIDDKQAKQLLYHLVQNVQFSSNTSKSLKKLLLTKTIIKKANEFHRIGESNIKEIKEE